MGADGGVCWIPGADFKACLDLLEPWLESLLNFGSYTYEDSRNDFVRNRHLPGLVGGYGTDFVDNPTLSSLPDWLRYIDELLVCTVRSLPKDATFDDLLMERETRPYPYYIDGEDYYRTNVEWMRRLKGESYYRPDQIKKLAAFRKQKIADWRAAVGIALTGEPNGIPYVLSEETWT